MSELKTRLALSQAIAATPLPAFLLPPAHCPPPTNSLPPAPHGATKTHTAPQKSPENKTNPPPPAATHPAPLSRPTKPLNPNQLTAARLLLAGHPIYAIAQVLRINPYTISRWKKDPRFQLELKRQIRYQSRLARNTAPQKPTPRHIPQAP